MLAHQNHLKSRPFIVAIDGLGGSGKTTLTNHLQKWLHDVVVIHMDDHIVCKEQRYNTGHEEWYEYYQLQWDTKYVQANVFEKLHANEQTLYLPFYDKEKDRVTYRSVPILENSIVLMEGVFLLREEWKAYYDFTIYLDCPKAIRSARVLQRDTYIGDVNARLQKYETRYWQAEEHYVAAQNPREQASFIQTVGMDERSTE